MLCWMSMVMLVAAVCSSALDRQQLGLLVLRLHCSGGAGRAVHSLEVH